MSRHIKVCTSVTFYQLLILKPRPLIGTFIIKFGIFEIVIWLLCSWRWDQYTNWFTEVTLFVVIIISTYRVFQKKVTNRQKSLPKWYAIGLNLPINMSWERLILLSLGKKRAKNIFQAQGVPATGDWTGAPWLLHMARYVT